MSGCAATTHKRLFHRPETEGVSHRRLGRRLSGDLSHLGASWLASEDMSSPSARQQRRRPDTHRDALPLSSKEPTARGLSLEQLQEDDPVTLERHCKLWQIGSRSKGVDLDIEKEHSRRLRTSCARVK